MKRRERKHGSNFWHEKARDAAMENAAFEGDVCARVGGDEYNVVGIGYDDKKAEAFIAAFQKYLDDFNANSELPYLVRASVGYYLMPIDGTDSLEHCINAADASLYEFKRKKKEQKLDNVIRINE